MRRTPFLMVPMLALAVVFGACSSDDTASDSADGGGTSGGSSAVSGERVDIDGSEAVVWGDGPRGAILAHGAAFDAASWQDQAEQIAERGFTVVAVEDISAEGITGANSYLRDDKGVSDVAFIGGSAGADAMLGLLSEQPDLADQVILLSPNRVVEGLGSQPKLFIASEDEPVADVSSELADTAPGDQNEAMILPGSAHAQNLFDSDQAGVTIDAILERLQSVGS